MSTPQFPSDSDRYPEASQATTVLVLGIVSLVVCQVLSPFAWVLGKRELEAIDNGRRPPENRATANTGRILGMIGTALLAIGILVGIFFLLFLVPVSVSG